MDYPKLFSPQKIGNIEIKNRGVMTAMGMGLAKEDGTATQKQSIILLIAPRAESV